MLSSLLERATAISFTTRLRAVSSIFSTVLGIPPWIAIVVCLVVAVVYLLSATPPWESSYAERKAEGRLLRALDYARFYSWWAALINAGVLLLLIATVRWWGAPATGHSTGPGRPVFIRRSYRPYA